MKRRRRIEREVEKTDRWVVSYADFITLLFAFFATLYALSVVDTEKLRSFAASLKDALHQEGLEATAVREQRIIPIPEVMGEVEAGIRGILKGRDDVEVRKDERGVIVTLGESFLFRPGKAELKESSLKALGELAIFLKGLGNRIMIEGHTDSIPHKGGERSNWMLSVRRAYAVLQVFVERFGIPPERIILAGYGPYRPVRENSTPEGRAKNRRVDIVILKDGW